MDEPANKALIEKWKTADALYATPTGSNDDWWETYILPYEKHIFLYSFAIYRIVFCHSNKYDAYTFKMPWVITCASGTGCMQL